MLYLSYNEHRGNELLRGILVSRQVFQPYPGRGKDRVWSGIIKLLGGPLRHILTDLLAVRWATEEFKAAICRYNIVQKIQKSSFSLIAHDSWVSPTKHYELLSVNIKNKRS